MKKRILWLSNFSLANSGFGKSTKEILTRLHKSGKYEICELAAGTADHDANVMRVPWRVIGILPRNQEEMARFHAADEGLRRAYQYGLFRFDEAVADFKPDVVVVHEDLWSVTGWIKNSPHWGKFNLVMFSPLDAEPLSEEFATFLKDVPNIWTYSDWSQKIGFNAGLKQTKVIPLGVNPDIFKPIDKNRVSNLRFKFGLKETDFVVIMVARNQIRKKFDALLLSIEDMKQINPELHSRIKILPFSCWSDPAGIPFAKLIKSRNIDESKVLVPYICHACKEYHIAHKYDGDEKQCPVCKTEKSCHTPFVNVGLTDEQLNEVYNISDVKVLATSNEGFGIPLCEALAAGKSIITTGYLTGAEIAEKSNAGILIPYSPYTEYGTLFTKANVTSSDIARKISQYYKLSPEKKNEMSRNARKCILDIYNYDVITKSIDKELDQIAPLVNVDWTIRPPKAKNPNPNAQLPECQNDLEWLCALYKNILDVDIIEETKNKPLEHDGIKYWINALQKGQTKQEVEGMFRKIAQDDFNKKPVDIMSFLDPADEKRLLFCMPMSAGDVFISTAVIAGIKDKYPKHSIYFATKPEFMDIVKNNPNIKGVIPVQDYMLQYAWGVDRFSPGIFDFVLTPTTLTQMGNANWAHGAKTKSFLLEEKP